MKKQKISYRFVLKKKLNFCCYQIIGEEEKIKFVDCNDIFLIKTCFVILNCCFCQVIIKC